MSLEFRSTDNPGRECQAVGTARFLGQDPGKIHDPVCAVVGNTGDSQCYLGVREKVDAIQAVLSARILTKDLPVRLIAPYFVGGISDGQLNGTPRMRFSLIGREVSHDSVTLHLSGSDVRGVIAVVACDKPPVGTLAAIAEHNWPAIIMSDGSIRPGQNPLTGEPCDIVVGFQVAGDPDQEKRSRVALQACPGYGSCGGMFTYNTIQSAIAVMGMEPLHMVSPASEDPRRLTEFPNQLVDYLEILTQRNIKPRDIITARSLRNAMIAAMALGGSTNVALHLPEIARAAGLDFWNNVLTQDEFNRLSLRVRVLTNARPYGYYSMVDIDRAGGLQAVVKELLNANLLDGSCITCTGETLAEQIERLAPPKPDGKIIYSFNAPFKENGGLRVLRGNLAPEGGAVIKVAGVEGGLEDGVFRGKAKTFDSEVALLEAIINTPEIFEDHDIVVIRYEGPEGAPGMPEMLDPTSRITTLCRAKGITIALMTDARFSGGSVGLVVGHVGPEAILGGPIALVKDGDHIIIDLNKNSIDCVVLADPNIREVREAEWKQAVAKNGGVHPAAKPVDNRLLRRMRDTATSALNGAGMP